ncbi:hypothetical protein MERGE_000441 [Pneumocystis wakefieldiae]|uniref:Uncharacterized protein n=1 Tax=Pneumocystis wakefieldiae TaxID=38082 RepID=A0A899FVG5_9ASCO|nr:hypothetical protein MERGE_000441 [Pneumocystis wakefieldiae]
MVLPKPKVYQEISRDGVQQRHRGLPRRARIKGVERVVAVASAKGGVGKSTVSANLAIAGSLSGRKVGLLDADLYGPSAPKMFNLSQKPDLSRDKKFIPLVNYGVKTMSMGFFINKDSPIVWRGLMVMKTLQQLIYDVDWGDLDLLVIDMPPGTGDTQLTITQHVILDGVVVISTPQDIALIDAIRCINMFKKMDVNILGIVKNMSVFVCPNCHYSSHIFGRDKLDSIAKNINVEVLADIPLHEKIMQDCEDGYPTVAAEPDGPQSLLFRRLADIIWKKV